ncbi:hypothetical protein [Phreatobacter sp.]|uniref:hypothetical protein n=1 Tax=Phreatobacter sp. TaxID=1966341 RepID=UPI003F715CE9
MAIRTAGILNGFGAGDFVTMKERLADLQRQLGSGKKSETYGGLGADRGFSLAFRSSLTQINAWQQNISVVATRINIIETSLTGIHGMTSSVKTALQPNDFTLSSGRTYGQISAADGLNAVVSMLNANDGSRYVFGGRKTATPPVVDPLLFMNGEGAKDGFKTVLLERMQADLGATGASPEQNPAASGRVSLSGAASDPVILAEDGVHAFGLKVGTVTGAIDGVAATVTPGPPASVSLASAAGNAMPGQSLSLSFTLPDGSTELLTLQAVAADAENLTPEQFRVGANAAESLENLRTNLAGQLDGMVRTKLAAASAVKAGEDFFRGETSPVALAGPPAVEYGAPLRLVPGLSGTMSDAVAYDSLANADARTMRWYQGDRTTSPPRTTATAEIDSAQSVSYGARASEDALRSTVQYLAVASAITFSSADPHGLARYQALTPRVSGGLSMEDSAQSVQSILIEISAASTAANSAKTRHGDSYSMLQNLLGDIEDVDPNEIAVFMLAMKTSLEASYQTTSMLSQLSLLKYI